MYPKVLFRNNGYPAVKMTNGDIKVTIFSKVNFIYYLLAFGIGTYVLSHAGILYVY